MKYNKKILAFFITITLLLLIGSKTEARQFYFLIDLKSPMYKVNKVKLSAKKLYGTSTEIELYNLMFEDRLILFSILPSTTKWKEIDPKELQNKLIDFNRLKDVFEKGFQVYLKSDSENTTGIKRDDIDLVIVKDGKYLVANFCLSEYFVTLKNPLLFPNQMGDAFININSPLLSVKEFEALFNEKFKRQSPNLLTDVGYTIMDYPFFRKPLNFLAGIENVAGKKAYRYWHYTDWRVSDGYNIQRGVDRFLYVPEFGIIAGSYDFWFAKNLKGKAFGDLSRNYFAEKIMYPIEINGFVLEQ